MANKNEITSTPNKSKKKKSKLTGFFYLLVIFIASLLLVALAFVYKGLKEDATSSSQTNDLSSSESADASKSSFYFKLLNPFGEKPDASEPKVEASLQTGKQESDEFLPPMKTFIDEKELSSSFNEDLFDDISSRTNIDTGHSTLDKDVIYIYQSHSREAFLPYLKNVNEPEEAFHSKANVTLVGKMLGKALERRGIGSTVNSTDIIQELDLRGLDYGSSYLVSGEQVKAAIQDNPDLDIFIDIHRDSLRKDSTTVNVNGDDYARILFIVGTGHKEFEKNLAFAKELQLQLDTNYPNLSKGILEKDKSQGNGVYNQNLAANAIIVEIGGVDNTVDELYLTVEALADVLSNNYWHE
ncbi:stage II sporulation protein P [Planococcus donghaensis MPA1U2]|uniref:Stage II sporulation protein P n=1 Tax=Planococcus donghaensis MPA1U2 TaxID=933115 RepID=E7RD71_9BACL|nr:stage II sporulation protein P [Planococcus donghaensis]EGA91021.1 stage II sporulation protein P [Planococcus donghaensis MPA1U2]